MFTGVPLIPDVGRLSGINTSNLRYQLMITSCMRCCIFLGVFEQCCILQCLSTGEESVEEMREEGTDKGNHLVNGG